MFVTVSHFNPSSIFVGNVRSLTEWSPSCDSALRIGCITANVRLGRKQLTVTNALAFHNTEPITTVKNLMVQGQGVNDMKDSLSLTLQQNKLERLSPTSINLAFARKTPSVASQSNIMQN